MTVTQLSLFKEPRQDRNAILNKKCPTCKIEKPITEFSKNRHSKDGYQSECKSCQRKRSKKDYNYKNAADKIPPTIRTKIIELRKQLFTEPNIEKETGVTRVTARRFLEQYYKANSDPVHIFIRDNINKGDCVNDIARQLNTDRRYIAKVIKRKPEFFKKQKYTVEEQRVIDARKQLKTVSQILRIGGVPFNKTKVNWLIKNHFGDKDPFTLHVIDAVKQGESGKSICRRLNIGRGSISYILKKHDIKLWDLYLQKINGGKKKIKKRDTEQYAKDLYCYYINGMSIRDIAAQEGYTRGGAITAFFSQYIPGYKEASKKRREESKTNKCEKIYKKRSSIFRFEKDFSKFICDDILGDYDVERNVRNRSSMEIDCLAHTDKGDILIELKIQSRKVDEARAFGQCAINKATYNGSVLAAIVCFPDDVDVSVHLLDCTDVYFCNSSALESTINSIG